MGSFRAQGSNASWAAHPSRYLRAFEWNICPSAQDSIESNLPTVPTIVKELKIFFYILAPSAALATGRAQTASAATPTASPLSSGFPNFSAQGPKSPEGVKPARGKCALNFKEYIPHEVLLRRVVVR